MRQDAEEIRAALHDEEPVRSMRQLRQIRRELEGDLLLRIREFEDRTGLAVTGLTLTRHHVLGQVGWTSEVRLEASLPREY